MMGWIRHGLRRLNLVQSIFCADTPPGIAGVRGSIPIPGPYAGQARSLAIHHGKESPGFTIPMSLTRQQRTTVAVILLAAFLAVLNQTLLTPALPTIMSHLSISATTAQWLTSGYALLEAIIIPLNAYFLGRFPTRRLLVGSMGLFALGSALCGVAPNFPMLMAARLVQAAATGILMPTVFVLVLTAFPKEERGTAMGLLNLVMNFGPAVGPSVSGVIVDTAGWRALFLFVAVLAVVMVLLLAHTVRNSGSFAAASIDVVSVALLASGVFSLLFGLSTFTSGNPAVSVALMVAGVLLTAAFSRRQLGLETPMLAVGVLRYRRFRIASIIVGILEAILISSGVILPILTQNAIGESATASGLLMLPGAAIGAACGLFAGRVFDRHGVRRIALAGGIVLLVGTVGYFSFTLQTPIPAISLAYGISCVGLQTLVTPINTWGINSLPNEAVPHGNAIVTTFQQVGSSFGTAFAVSLTALWQVVAPNATSAAEQTLAGCHMAFAGIFCLALVVAIAILVFVRDK